MYKPLVLTQRHKDFIQMVCDLEHDALIACHDHDQAFVDELVEKLDTDWTSVKEYQKELSNAFFEFQVIKEDPDKIAQMDPHYMGLFQDMVNIFGDRLKKQFPDLYGEFQEFIGTMLSLKSSVSLN